MWWNRLRLAKRLGITHGALVALLVLLLVVTLQGLLRMVNVMTGIANERLSGLDAEQDIHRAAWNIEVELRHAHVDCSEGHPEAYARDRIDAARTAFAETFASSEAVAPRLRDVALRYQKLADEALAGPTCPFLAQPGVEERRLRLDEEMTNTWIDRLHDLNSDIEAKEASARQLGNRTALSGLLVAVLAGIVATYVARLTARSVTRPIARLGADATRLGDGDFTPIKVVDGPPEIEALRRSLERTREKMLGVDRLKQAFLASVSHELRSPLGRLREALSLLGDGTLGELAPKQARVLKLASRACEQEVRIVEALLDMSRVSTGLPVQREAACDLTKVIEAAAEAERDAAKERGVEIVIEARKTPPSLRLDSALVERAIANLVRNAVSVSPRGSSVRIVVDLLADDEGQVVRIDVVDDGPGVTEAVASRIFQPFNAGQVKDRPAGIGLGLSLAREVARAHGGDLELARGEKATTFRMELPASTLESGED